MVLDLLGCLEMHAVNTEDRDKMFEVSDDNRTRKIRETGRKH